jgi:hypothetical protein
MLTAIGIRQIKFSALETNWHEKIGKVRNKELAEQWNVYKLVFLGFFVKRAANPV